MNAGLWALQNSKWSPCCNLLSLFKDELSSAASVRTSAVLIMGRVSLCSQTATALYDLDFSRFFINSFEILLTWSDDIRYLSAMYSCYTFPVAREVLFYLNGRDHWSPLSSLLGSYFRQLLFFWHAALSDFNYSLESLNKEWLTISGPRKRSPHYHALASDVLHILLSRHYYTQLQLKERERCTTSHFQHKRVT